MDWDRLNIVFGTNHERAVILSEKLTRAEIYELFRRFVRLQVLTQVRKACRSPRALGKLLRKVIAGKPLVDS